MASWKLHFLPEGPRPRYAPVIIDRCEGKNTTLDQEFGKRYRATRFLSNE